MYSQTDIDFAHKQWRGFYLLQTAFSLVLFTAIGYFFITRSYLPTLLLSFVWYCEVLFMGGTKGKLLRTYYRFLTDMKKGKQRSSKGAYLSMRGPFWFENKEVYEMLLLEEDDFERKLYFDALKPLPQLERGQLIECTTYGNFVIDLQICTATAKAPQQ